MATDGEPHAGIGIIGGSGFYEMEGVTGPRRLHVPTPFGDPSSPVTVGTLHGRDVAFISRHDEGHRLLPAELPSRANIYALKRLGVRQVLAVSAVGSLREDIEPLHAVVPDQIIDRTGRDSSFFGEGIVAHVAFADRTVPASPPRWSSPPRRPASPSTPAARWWSSMGRLSPRAPSRSSTARGVPRSSG